MAVCIGPDVSIGAKYAADAWFAEKLQEMALHPSNRIVVDFEKHAIFQFAIFLVASLDLNLSVEASHRLDFS